MTKTESLGYSKSIEIPGAKITSILCVPIIPAVSDLTGVIELRRHIGRKSFGENVLEYVRFMCSCFASSNLQWSTSIKLQEKLIRKEITEEFSRNLFFKLRNFNSITGLILKYSCELVSAERSSFYLYEKCSNELVAELCCVNQELISYKDKHRCLMSEDIRGAAASGKETVNISDCYTDKRYDRKKNKEDGFIARNIVCVPILSDRNEIFGVLEVINKIASQRFTEKDISELESLLQYCSGALQFSLRFMEVEKQRHQLELTIDSCFYPFKLEQNNKEINFIENSSFQEYPPEIESHTFRYTDFKTDDIPHLFKYMAEQLFGKSALPQPQLMHFLMSLKTNYLPNEYHNFLHALCFAQSMYWIMRNNETIFTTLEMKALMIASICHDLCHPGVNENYLKAVNDSFATLYKSPLLERHHIQTSFMILMGENRNIFCNDSTEEYQQILFEIQHAILATYVERYGEQTEILANLLNENIFSMEEKSSRDALKAVLMMVCDLSASWKPWDVHRFAVWDLYNEFYIQGDREEALGLQPVRFMMRQSVDHLPEYQIQFLENVCLPAFRLITEVLPNIKVIVDSTLENIEHWKLLSSSDRST